MGTMPARLTNPTVGLMPTRPLAEEGQTTEPSVSVPIAIAQRFAATATPEPALEAPGQPTGNPPRDPRALAAANLLRASPGTRRSLSSIGRSCGASARTLQRLFAADTGLPVLAAIPAAALLLICRRRYLRLARRVELAPHVVDADHGSHTEAP